MNDVTFATREEWLAWRKQGIGSSDVPAILNLSPYKKPFAIFKDKIAEGEPVEKNSFITDRGHELEPIAREKFASAWNFERDTEETFGPANVVSPVQPHFRASLDGRSNDFRIILEIKYQGDDAHDSGVIPDHYYAQMQWQLFISNAEECYFVSINKNRQIRYQKVVPDRSYIMAILPKLQAFWDQVVEKKFAGESKDDSVLQLFLRRQELKDHQALLQEEIHAIEKTIFDSNVEHCGDFKVLTTNRAGNVDYSKIPELKDVDLEKYRKAGTTYKQIKGPAKPK